MNARKRSTITHGQESAEYWLIDPFERAVEVYRLDQRQYGVPEVATQEIVSAAIPGLQLDLRELFDSK